MTTTAEDPTDGSSKLTILQSCCTVGGVLQTVMLYEDYE